MIKIIAIGFVAAVTTVDAHVLTFTTRPDKKEFGFFEAIEITSEIRVSANSVGQAYPEGISGNVVYEVEYESEGTFLPLEEYIKGGGRYLWGAKVEDVTVDDSPLMATFDLRRRFSFEKPGRYRVRGHYRADNKSSTFDKVSDWSEFEIKPQTQREMIAYQDWESTGAGKTKAEILESYEVFAAKYPTDDITARVYPKILHYCYKTGNEERALNFLLRVINNRNISKLERRMYAYEIGTLEEKIGRKDEAIRWYRQCGLQNADKRVEKIQHKG